MILNYFYSSHICATDPANTGKDTCQRDSGGPIFLKENGRYEQINEKHKKQTIIKFTWHFIGTQLLG